MFVNVRFDKGILCLVFLDNCHCFVCRTIILDDELMDRVGLADDGIQLLPYILCTIIGTHYYRYCFHLYKNLLIYRFNVNVFTAIRLKFWQYAQPPESNGYALSNLNIL